MSATDSTNHNSEDRAELSSSVGSSLIREVSYDPFLSVLSIEFTNGGLYEYIGVPEETYTELLQAPSVGKFFHVHVKNKFQFLRRK